MVASIDRALFPRSLEEFDRCFITSDLPNTLLGKIMSSESPEKLAPEIRRIIDELLRGRSQTSANANLGVVELNAERLKSLKQILRQNEQLLQPFFDHLLDNYLCKDNVMVRLYTVVLVDEIFRRSNRFRECVIANFEEFLKFTLETDALRHPMPTPMSLAKNLKERTLKIVHNWYNEFGKAYRKLQVAYEYLKSCKTFDFQRIEAETVVERERLERERRRQKQIKERVMKKVTEDLQDIEDDMRKALTEINNAFCLLVPELSIDDNISTSRSTRLDMTSAQDNILSTSSLSGDYNKPSNSTNGLQAHGILNPKFDISINIQVVRPVIKFDQNNADLIINLKDCNKLIAGRYLPKIRQLLAILSKYGGDQELIKILIDWRMRLDDAKRKFDDLRLEPSPTATAASETGEDEADFEVVPEKEGFEELFRPPSPDLAEHIRDFSKSDSVKPKSSIGVSTIGSWREAHRDRQESISSDRSISESKSEAANIDKDTVGCLIKDDEGCLISTDDRDRFVIDDQGKRQLFITNESHSPSSSSDLDFNRSVVGDQYNSTTSITDPRPNLSVPSRNSNISGRTSPSNQNPHIRTVPYGIDLEYWENDKVIKPMIIRNNADCHRFWRPADGEEAIQCSDIEAAAYRTRVMEFVGEFQPIERECRAPLKGKDEGKLCNRRDRYRCPFHGLIIDRDQYGHPLDKASTSTSNGAARSNPGDASIFGNSEFLADVERATGQQLTSDKKKRKREEISAESSGSSRERLQKKIFNRSAIKRVAAAQEASDWAKHKKKFAGQWQYVFRDQ